MNSGAIAETATEVTSEVKNESTSNAKRIGYRMGVKKGRF